MVQKTTRAVQQWIAPLQQHPHTLWYFSAYILLGATMASLGPTLWFFSDQTGAAIDLVAALISARSIGYLLGSFTGGRLYDRISSHHLLAGVLLLAGISLAALPWIRSLLVLTGIMLVVGIAEGALDVGANTLLSWTHDAQTPTYLNAMFFLAGLGGFVTPLVFEAFRSSSLGIPAGYLLLALLHLPVAAFIFRARPPKSAASRVDAARTPRLLFAAFCVLALLFIGSEVAFSSWIYTYFMQRNLGASTGAASLNSLFWLGITLGRLGSVFVAARFQPKTIVAINLFGLIISFFSILILPGYVAAVFIGTFSVGLFLASLFPMTFADLTQRISLSGGSAGILWASGSLGATLLPWIVGRAMPASGAQTLPGILLASFILAALIFFSIQNTHRARLPQ